MAKVAGLAVPLYGDGYGNGCGVGDGAVDGGAVSNGNGRLPQSWQ